jgi:hypothetical protein
MPAELYTGLIPKSGDRMYCIWLTYPETFARSNRDQDLNWRELAMEVHLDSEESPTSGNKEMGKRRRPAGRLASSPAEVADQTGRLMAQREPEWLGRLTSDPASFAVVEREVHEQTRRQADLYVAGLLAKASEHPETADHVLNVIAAAQVPLRPVEKKKASLDCAASGGLGDHGDDPLLLATSTHQGGPRFRGKWALPGIGGLSDQRRLQSQRAG